MPVDTGAILEVTDLYKRFQGIEVLRGVTLSIRRGGITALIGSNGAGKSTLLNLVSGALRPDRGAITLDGHDITGLSSHMRARGGLSRTFQHPRVFGSLTVSESVLFAATPPHDEVLPRSLWRRGRDAYVDIAACLRRCKLDHMAEAPAKDLSYGEQKLLMLAQVLARESKLLFFDELCAGLEAGLLEHVKQTFRSLASEGKSILFVEHNLELVREIADRVVFLHLGKVFREGETTSVLEDAEVVSHYLGQ